jgi:hypothetical protein
MSEMQEKQDALKQYLQADVEILTPNLFKCQGRTYLVLTEDELENAIAEQTEIRNQNWYDDTSIECPVPGGNGFLMDRLDTFISEQPECTPWDAISRGTHSSGHDFSVLAPADSDESEFRVFNVTGIPYTV